MQWSDLHPIWQACLEEAWQAFLHGSVPIGAVITNANNEIIARGRNHIFDDNPPPGQVSRNQLAHAELNALLHFDRTANDQRRCSIYTSLEPCPLCMGAIYMMGIRHLHYAARDSYAGSTNLLGSTPYLIKKDIHVFGPENPDLEKALIAMVVLFDLQRHDYSTNPKIGEVIEAWHAVCPEGVELGKKLSRTSKYLELKKTNTPAEQGFNFIFSELIAG